MSSSAALALARKLAGYPEPAMREQVLLAYLEKSTDLEETAAVLDEFQRGGRSGGPPFNIALRTLIGLLSQELISYELQASIYSAAKAAGLQLLVQLFFSGQSSPSGDGRAEPQRELTLGHRKTLARSSDPQVLARLLREPEQPVIHNLLSNPRLTEEHVVRLAAKRPTTAAIQQEISVAPRWLARYRVKRALVLNPYTPSELSIRLLGFLTIGDLKLVQSSPTLADAVRGAAAKLASKE